MIIDKLKEILHKVSPDYDVSTVTENTNPQRERLSLVIIIAGSLSPKQGDVLVQQYAGEEQNSQREPDEGDNPDPTLSRKH